ncbi:MAG: type II secretion system protein GspN [Sandaracinaceae bacterium]|nr:type II secretion system protein GspN [Sandaracinaceae bacterium]
MTTDLLKKIALYGAGYPGFFLVFVVLGAYWTFPYDRVRDYIIQEVERDGSTQLEIESLEPSWLTGVELEGVRYAKVPEGGGEPAVLEISHLEARVSVLSLIAGEQDVSFAADLSGGIIEGNYAASEEQTHVEATLTNVDLRRIGPLRAAVGLPITGRANGSVDLTIAREAANTTGSADLTVRGVSLGDGETPLVIEGLGAGLTLERMNLGTLELRMRTERGVGTLERLRADGRARPALGHRHGEARAAAAHELSRPAPQDQVQGRVPRVERSHAGAVLALGDEPAGAAGPHLGRGAPVADQGAFASRIRMTPSGRTEMPGVD